jgi:hypothetical protein
MVTKIIHCRFLNKLLWQISWFPSVPRCITHQNLLTIKLSKALKDGALARRERKRDEPLDDEEQPLDVLPALQKYAPWARNLGQQYHKPNLQAWRWGRGVPHTYTLVLISVKIIERDRVEGKRRNWGQNENGVGWGRWRSWTEIMAVAEDWDAHRMVAAEMVLIRDALQGSRTRATTTARVVGVMGGRRTWRLSKHAEVSSRRW